MSRDPSNLNQLVHVQAHPDSYLPKTKSALEMMSGEVRKMVSDPSAFITKEIGGSIQNVADQISLLNLGYKLYDHASDDFKNSIRERELTTRHQAALDTAEKFEEGKGNLSKHFLSYMKTGDMNCRNYLCAHQELSNGASKGIGWVGPSVNSAIAWGNLEMKGLESELQPLVDASQRQTQVYSDHIGVTDRYKAYRINLNPSSLMHTECNGPRVKDAALDFTHRPYTAGRWDLPKEFENAKSIGTRNYEPIIPPLKLDAWNSQNIQKLDNDSAVKLSGMVTKYPQRSETQEAYKHPILMQDSIGSNVPPLTFRHKSEQPSNIRGRGVHKLLQSTESYTKGYALNPYPNYFLNGNLTINEEVMRDHFKTGSSEYANRFTYPDPKKLPRGINAMPKIE